MPDQKQEFKEAVARILEVVMFENWLRFYFIAEEPREAGENRDEPPLIIKIPAKSMERIRELYPTLSPLAEEMNDRPVDFETSRRAVLTYTLEYLDGKVIPREMAQNVFSSRGFQTQLQLFHAWTQLHEAQLDGSFMEFGKWRELFDEWRQGKGARELAARLEKGEK